MLINCSSFIVLWSIYRKCYEWNNTFTRSSIWARKKSHLRRWCEVLTEVTWPEVTWPEVTSVTCPVRKLRNIRPSGAFWPEVTTSRHRKRPCPQAALTGSRFCACPVFSRAFFLVVLTWLPDVTQGHLIPSGFSWVYATGSCATSVMTEGHVTPSEVSMGCSLRRPRPIILGNSASYIQHGDWN